MPSNVSCCLGGAYLSRAERSNGALVHSFSAPSSVVIQSSPISEFQRAGLLFRTWSTSLQVYPRVLTAILRRFIALVERQR
jgi:hypothetical protein